MPADLSEMCGVFRTNCPVPVHMQAPCQPPGAPDPTSARSVHRADGEMYYTDFAQIPDDRYSVIYADPPWSYNDKMKGHSFSLDHEYQTQDLKWIKRLPVEAIAAPDCALFLWVVSPQLDDGIDVLKAWGFRYKTLAFCWSKETTHGHDVSNLGKWTMGNVELCLLGVRGRPQRIAKNVKQLVRAVRNFHSRKPDDVRQRIETLMGDVPRIELFQRGAVPGWDGFGNTPVFK